MEITHRSTTDCYICHRSENLEPLFWVYHYKEGPIITGLFCDKCYELSRTDRDTWDTLASARAFLIKKALSWN